jgi:hypothetical protein
MDVQHSYEISLKKDALFINLSSDDVYFISKQMDKWFRILLDDNYVPVSLPPPPSVLSEPEPDMTLPQPSAVTLPPQEPVDPLAPVVQTPQSMPPSQSVEPKPPVAVIAPLETVMPNDLEALEPSTVQPTQPSPQPQPTVTVNLPPVVQPPAASPGLSVVPSSLPEALDTLSSSPEPEAVQDDFESVMDTVMRDLEKPVELRPSGLPVQPEAFDLPVATADLSLVSSLADLCEQANAGSSEDFLLLASYYLNQIEYQDSFSLKRINSNLVKSGLTPVNHSILESVLSQGYLSMVPDLTGMAEVSEYAITPEGLDKVNRLF